MSEPLIVINADSYDLDTCEQDTREKLEADVHQYANPDDYENTLGSFWEKKIISFLDRQAAITRRETLLENPLHNNPYVGLVRGKQWERKQASDYHCGRCGWKVTDHDSYCSECGGALHKASNKPNSQFDVPKTAETAENATLKSEIHNFDDTREQLEAEVMVTVGNLVQYCDAHPVLFEKAKSWLDRQAAITTKAMQDYVNRKLSIRGWKAQMDKLQAERDELQAAIDAMGNGQFYAMYRKACEERDRFKDMVRKQSDSNH